MTDDDAMRAALDLARTMRGRTGDNPSVGCLIVRDGAIIAQGVTDEGGRPHAEERALAGLDARGATAFVTLEPCAQRTSGAPSCTDLLIAAGLARVVIAVGDPHPFANGRGVERLRAAGVAVEIGRFEDEAAAINTAFFARLRDHPSPP